MLTFNQGFKWKGGERHGCSAADADLAQEGSPAGVRWPGWDLLTGLVFVGVRGLAVDKRGLVRTILGVFHEVLPSMVNCRSRLIGRTRQAAGKSRWTAHSNLLRLEESSEEPATCGFTASQARQTTSGNHL
jgi:hypothetical protein